MNYTQDVRQLHGAITQMRLQNKIRCGFDRLKLNVTNENDQIDCCMLLYHFENTNVRVWQTESILSQRTIRKWMRKSLLSFEERG